jgi:Zinc carboxypeptidase
MKEWLKRMTALTGLLLMASTAPTTLPERTDYRSTSRYDDVIAFIRAIQKIDPDVRVENFATTNEGRALPLVILGPHTPRTSKLPVVFIMANIHAGEVEGKEAAQMLLRDLVTTHRKLRDRMVILIAPIYNADGNERISTEHRKTQVGPATGEGIRENAQGLDLNRDYMKLETPEAHGLVHNVLERWDPLVTVDLHTTNGSYHGYHLTYSPPLNPNADARLIAFERETLLPEIRERMKKRHGKLTYYYGNFEDQLKPEKGWFTFDNRPRFGNNYVGLRNRFAILSEAYSYIGFRERVEVTHQFLHEILNAVDRHGAKMMRIAAKADANRPKSQGVRFEIKPWQKNVTILWERATPAPPGEGIENPETGSGPPIIRSGEIEPVKMTDYGIFAATEKSDVPYAFVIDARATRVVENLLTHGIVVERLNESTKLRVDQFAIAKSEHSGREFQKHHELTLQGKWKSRGVTFDAGTFIVRTNQPLARLAFYLLDPRSDDGLFEWGFFDELLGDVAPVSKVMKPAPIDATIAGSAAE